MPNRILILQADRITAVVLYHGVFQDIVFFLWEAHYGKEYRKLNDNRTSLIDRLTRRG